MAIKILVAYATKVGSTAEIADFIGQRLRLKGAEVDVRNIKNVRELGPYQALVIGSATRTMHILPEVLQFAAKHRAEISRLPTAYFIVGMTMKQDTPENRIVAANILRPLVDIKKPVSLGLFAGKLQAATVGPIQRLTAPRTPDGSIVEGDFRKWDDIRAWAEGLMPLLKDAVVPENAPRNTREGDVIHV